MHWERLNKAAANIQFLPMIFMGRGTMRSMVEG
jgi:hypothetical protein